MFNAFVDLPDNLTTRNAFSLDSILLGLHVIQNGNYIITISSTEVAIYSLLKIDQPFFESSVSFAEEAFDHSSVSSSRHVSSILYHHKYLYVSLFPAGDIFIFNLVFNEHYHHVDKFSLHNHFIINTASAWFVHGNEILSLFNVTDPTSVLLITSEFEIINTLLYPRQEIPIVNNIINDITCLTYNQNHLIILSEFDLYCLCQTNTPIFTNSFNERFHGVEYISEDCFCCFNSRVINILKFTTGEVVKRIDHITSTFKVKSFQPDTLHIYSRNKEDSYHRVRKTSSSSSSLSIRSFSIDNNDCRLSVLNIKHSPFLLYVSNFLTNDLCIVINSGYKIFMDEQVLNFDHLYQYFHPSEYVFANDLSFVVTDPYYDVFNHFYYSALRFDYSDYKLVCLLYDFQSMPEYILFSFTTICQTMNGLLFLFHIPSRVFKRLEMPFLIHYMKWLKNEDSKYKYFTSISTNGNIHILRISKRTLDMSILHHLSEINIVNDHSFSIETSGPSLFIAYSSIIYIFIDCINTKHFDFISLGDGISIIDIKPVNESLYVLEKDKTGERIVSININSLCTTGVIELTNNITDYSESLKALSLHIFSSSANIYVILNNCNNLYICDILKKDNLLTLPENTLIISTNDKCSVNRQLNVNLLELVTSNYYQSELLSLLCTENDYYNELLLMPNNNTNTLLTHSLLSMDISISTITQHLGLISFLRKQEDIGLFKKVFLNNNDLFKYYSQLVNHPNRSIYKIASLYLIYLQDVINDTRDVRRNERIGVFNQLFSKALSHFDYSLCQELVHFYIMDITSEKELLQIKKGSTEHCHLVKLLIAHIEYIFISNNLMLFTFLWLSLSKYIDIIDYIGRCSKHSIDKFIQNVISLRKNTIHSSRNIIRESNLKYLKIFVNHLLSNCLGEEYYCDILLGFLLATNSIDEIIEVSCHYSRIRESLLSVFYGEEEIITQVLNFNKKRVKSQG